MDEFDGLVGGDILELLDRWDTEGGVRGLDDGLDDGFEPLVVLAFLLSRRHHIPNLHVLKL